MQITYHIISHQSNW